MVNVPYWRLSALYFFYFALLGAIIPFWNLYLSDKQLSARQIGVLGAILLGTKIISPYVIGLHSDRSSNPMRVIQRTNLLALIGFVVIFVLPGAREFGAERASGLDQLQPFVALCFIVLFFSFFWNGVIAQYEAVTLLNLGQHYQRYGSIRVWGSAGFIVAVVVLGWMFEWMALAYLPVIMSLMLAFIWLSSLTLNTTPQVEVKTVGEGAGSFRWILRQSHVLWVLFVCFLMKFSYGTYYTFFTIYLIDYGYSEAQIGFFWGLSVLAELALFYYAGKFIARYSLKTIFLVCFFAAMLRWWFIAELPQNLVALLVAQLSHALTFALYHAAAIEWVRRAFGEPFMGRGQALYSAVSFGLGGALGALTCGLLWTDHRSEWWAINWYISIVALVLGVLVLCFVKLPSQINSSRRAQNP